MSADREAVKAEEAVRRAQENVRIHNARTFPGSWAWAQTDAALVHLNDALSALARLTDPPAPPLGDEGVAQ